MPAAWIRVIVFLARIVPLLFIMITLTPGPVDFDEIPPLGKVDDPQERKRAFIQYLKPIIRAENDRIREQREDLLAAYWDFKNRGKVRRRYRDRVRQLFEEYDVDLAEGISQEAWIELQRRVDVIPMKLALAQSASESAWGTSRFARLGNSFFGQWTYKKHRGIKPVQRTPGSKHRVARFLSVEDSTRAYMHNLNTHWAYKKFRQLRYEQRLKGEKPDGLTLAPGLHLYSSRRHEYIEDIRTIIVANRELMENL